VSDKSAIEWTDATWNPVTGCSKVSPGCAHCYAETISLRFGHSAKPWTPANAAENVVLHPERLNVPLRWRQPRMVFVNSMSDLFHELVPDEYIAEVFSIMARAPRHTFQVLTKRPERMRDLLSSPVFESTWRDSVAEHQMGAGWAFWPLPNVWLGTSIENRRFVGRADALRETPAAVRFISAEPLLGPLVGRWFSDQPRPPLDLAGIDWLIVGGESGADHRLIRAEWVRDLHDAAQSAGTAFFFKQWGGRTPKFGGRLLDGRTWDEMPERVHVG
jgi:protein gp37